MRGEAAARDFAIPSILLSIYGDKAFGHVIKDMRLFERRKVGRWRKKDRKKKTEESRSRAFWCLFRSCCG